MRSFIAVLSLLSLIAVPTDAAENKTAGIRGDQVAGCTLMANGLYECPFLPGCRNDSADSLGLGLCNKAIAGGHFYPGGLPMTHDRLVRNLLSFLGGMLLYGSCFFLMHDRPFSFPGFGLLPKLYPDMWEELSFADRGDMASRLHSSLHAVICWLHFIGFSQCDIWPSDANGYLANDCLFSEVLFASTAGYFAFDLVLTIYYKMTFWQVFVVHHVAAFSPYFLCVFVWSQTNILLGLFINVETATLFLNYQNLLENRKLTTTKRYAFTFYLCYFLWFVTRGIMPIFITVKMLNDVEPVYGATWTAVVSYACCFFVVIFCNITFFAILTPDVINHCRGAKAGQQELPDGDAGGAVEMGQVPREKEEEQRRSVWVAPAEPTGESHFRSRASTIRV